MSKLIKHAMISSLSAAGRWSLATLKNKNLHLTYTIFSKYLYKLP